MRDNTSPARPKYTTFAGWQEMSTMGRSRTFEEIKAGNVRAIKIGGRTAIDVDASLAWLASLPSAGRPKAA
jgi:hypothetical protein